MARIKVGVCESPPELMPGSSDWRALCRAVERESPDLFLLNEMPFGKWIASGPSFASAPWDEACALHEEGTVRLAELGAPVVAGTRARIVEGRRVNEAFVWTRDGGAAGVHTKQYFPDEEGFYEARWFEPGERHFRVAEAGPVRGGFLICTEVMFNERARQYGRGGAEVIFVPRAAGRASLPRWMVAMKMAAIVSGCYVLSSNRGGADSRGQVFGGSGWVVTPEGEVVAQTSETTPVVFHEIATEAVATAQKDYPCYVKE
jgi:N-carbamoylputrescine amidase